jgi:hypothetical protein
MYTCRATVAEWLMLLTSNHLPLTAVGMNLAKDFGFFHIGSFPASLQDIVVLLVFTFVPEVRYRGALEIFHQQLSWKVAT